MQGQSDKVYGSLDTDFYFVFSTLDEREDISR
jgi:hypothetical protein